MISLTCNGKKDVTMIKLGFNEGGETNRRWSNQVTLGGK